MFKPLVSIFFFKKRYVHILLFRSGFVHNEGGLCGSQKKALDSTEPEFHVVVSPLTRVLETKFGYSAKTKSALRYQDIYPTPVNG